MRTICSVLLASLFVQPLDVRAADDREGVEFFEKRIRPVLVQHCYECHSADSKPLQGGLRLDSRAGLTTGGDSGPAFDLENVDASLLIQALRYDGLEMPPAGKLPAEVIADFETWLRMGAPDPRVEESGTATPRTIDIEAGRSHWAYRTPERRPAPDVHAKGWPLNEVDRFVLVGLESRQIAPASDADRETLVRRLYFDLVGLPPTPEQIDAFVFDSAPDPYERLVDRLLASPQFGERWGRHWLDVVRFAESITLRGFVLPEAWRYRDYVIESFNADRRYDQFLVEQLAGDLLLEDSLEGRQRNLIATAFLTLGNTNLEDQDKRQLEMDFIDEQLDVIGRGLLAQTITCARCHDHKFDPIPTRDYYAMAGILDGVRAIEHANVSKWIEVPLPLEESLEKQFEHEEALLAANEARVKDLKESIEVLSNGGSGSARPIIAAKDLPGVVVDDADARRVGDWTHSQSVKRFIGDGYSHDGDAEKGSKTLTFLPRLPADGEYEVRFAYTPGTNRSENAPLTVFSADGEKTIHVNQKQRPPIDDRFISLGRFRFEVNGQSFVIVSNEGTTGHVIADAVQFIPAEQAAEAAPVNPATDAQTADKIAQMRGELKGAEAELKQLRADASKRPMAMSVTEKAEIVDLPIHIRGSVHNLGEVAPRGFLQVAMNGNELSIPQDESGRLQLAHWIASPTNSLTARVMVNRVWHWLFGEGLVRSVDNFGTTGELPSHLELLDTLTVNFIESGWSVKHLVRKIVLSHAYRLSSEDKEHALAIDPENRLLWRMNLRRLDAECLRDTMLCAAGTLAQDMGGPSFDAKLASDYGFEDAGTRRSVYVPVFRNSLPEIFEAFDFANPSMVSGRRDVSTVAPQALFLMNHPFVMEQSRAAAHRLLNEDLPNDEARIREAYRTVIGRHPTASELDLALGFVRTVSSGSEESRLEAWTQFYQSLFSSIDMRYLR